MKANSEPINNQIHSRWLELLEKRKSADLLHIRASQAKQLALKELKSRQDALIIELKEMRKKISEKIVIMNRVHQHFSQQLGHLSRRRVNRGSKIVVISQQKLDNIAMQMNNFLKFDRVSKKKQKNELQFVARCNRIKDEIKKVKLKISLTELEINEAQKKSAKKSVKYRQ